MDPVDTYKEVEHNINSVLANPKGARYDNKAKFYERLVSTKLFNGMIWGTTPEDYKEFASHAILNTPGNIIDICCGGLAQTGVLYNATTNNCTLVDRSIEMLKIARSRLTAGKEAFPPNIRLLQANAFQLPFADNSFDTLCSFGAIHLFNNKQDFVNEGLRVLKSGGRFYYTSMTTEKTISRMFMAVLRQFNEFGKLSSAQQTLSLFNSETLNVESYMTGSVIFIHGQKK